MTLPDGMTAQGLPSHVLINTTLVVGEVLHLNITTFNWITVLRKALHIGTLFAQDGARATVRPTEPPDLKDLPTDLA